MVAVPAAVVVDVHHGEWAGIALLHRTVFDEGVWRVYARRCHAGFVEGDLEWKRISAVSGRIADECAASGLCELWVAMESLMMAKKSMILELTACELSAVS